jgi:hypothetical protein
LNYQPISRSFSNVPILGDGTGGKVNDYNWFFW